MPRANKDYPSLEERRRERLKGIERPVITQDPSLRIVGTNLEHAKRQAIGYDLLGAARMIEAITLGLRDHRMAFHWYFTEKERDVVEYVEVKALLKAANLLRRIGNRMTQTRLPE